MNDIASLYEEQLMLERGTLLAHLHIDKLTPHNAILQTFFNAVANIDKQEYLHQNYVTEISSHIFICATGLLVRV